MKKTGNNRNVLCGVNDLKNCRISDHRLPLNFKKEQAIDIYNSLGGSQGKYTEWKESIPKGIHCMMLFYMTYLKPQNYQDWERLIA